MSLVETQQQQEKKQQEAPDNNNKNVETMKNHTFEIRVALVGYVSVGKSTVLNALLGDKFSEVSLRRTTAGINFFRISQQQTKSKEDATGTEEKTATDEQDSSSEEDWSIVDEDEKPIKSPGDTHEEIAVDNKELRSSEDVSEKFFHIQTDRHPIINGMRKDTRLVLIDIPGINEAGDSSKKYKEYVESNWDTFDCVVVVLDAIQGVNTEEQVQLLEFVQQNNENFKDIPTILLGNKMDDLNDEDTINLIEETRSKTIEIFGNVDCSSSPEPKKGKSTATATFIPLSAKNAFTYRKAGNINLDQLNDPRHQDLVNKIGYDEYGRKWSKMNIDEQVEAVSEILRDPAEFDARLAGTNFHTFLTVLSNFVGGDTAQRNLLARQIDVELKRISNNSNGSSLVGKKAISESIYEVFKRCKAIGRTDTDNLNKTFWDAFKDCEHEAFDKGLAENADPTVLERPFVELEKYHDLATMLGWSEESIKAIGTMKRLLRRQISFLLERIENWSLDAFCVEVYKIETKTFYCGTAHCSVTKNYAPTTCKQKLNNASIKCGEEGKQLCGEWKVPEKTTWQNLSPQDWIAILDSLSLVWNQSRFIEDFGPEKVKLDETLAMFRIAFVSVFGMSIDSMSMAMDKSTMTCLQGYKDAVKHHGKDNGAITKVKMPNSLIDPSHWAYFAWKYIKFCNGRKDIIEGPVTEYGGVDDSKVVEDAGPSEGDDVDVTEPIVEE